MRQELGTWNMEPAAIFVGWYNQLSSMESTITVWLLHVLKLRLNYVDAPPLWWVAES